MESNKSHLKWFLAIGLLFTAAVFIWLILTPSLSLNLFFLNFSIQRFILIAITGIVLLTLSIGLVCSKNRLLNNIFIKLISSKAAFSLFFITTIIMIIIITGVLFRAFGDRTLFFERILPITLLGFLLSTEAITFQQITSRGEMGRSVWSTFNKSIRLVIKNALLLISLGTKKIARAAKPIEITIVIILCLYTVFNWLNQICLSPDSTNYITASINLVKTGRLFVFTNWPSFSMDPVIEPYTDYAPGFPYYLAPFIIIFKAPMLSAAIAQSFTILLFYLTIYLATILLGFRSFLRISTMLVFTYLHTFSVIHSTFWIESLYIVLSLGVGLCVMRMIQSGYKIIYWVLSFVLLILASSIKFIGISNIAWFIPILWVGLLPQDKEILQRGEKGEYAFRYSKSKKIFFIISVLVSAIAPVGLWFLRNILLYGKTTQSHGLFESVQRPTNVLVPFSFAYDDLLNIRLFPQWQLILLLIAITVIPFYVSSHRKRLIHLTLVCAVFFQFLGVWIPSLAASFDVLDDRLLSPTIAVGLLAIVYGLNCLSDHFQNRKVSYIVMSLPFLFLLLSNHVSVIKIEEVQSTIPNYPAEMYLWQNIRKLDWISTSSHFYTDYNFKHQIFAGIPQRIIWDESAVLEDPSVMRDLLNRDRSFLLLSQGSKEKKIIESYIINGKLPLEKIDYADFGFTLYYPSP